MLGCDSRLNSMNQELGSRYRYLPESPHQAAISDAGFNPRATHHQKDQKGEEGLADEIHNQHPQESKPS